jgi:exo-beta-1,3-glucanase (GH17 family)
MVENNNPTCSVHIEMVKELKANTELVQEFKNELATFKSNINQMKYILILIAAEGFAKYVGLMP